MNWILVPSLILAAITAPDEEMEAFFRNASQPAIEEASSFLEKKNPLPPSQQTKCSSRASFPMEQSPLNPSSNKLLIFTSFSVPLESWKEHSQTLEKTGGLFVLRGLPENSFSLLTERLTDLRKAGIRAEVVLDPESFEKYNIQAVPTIVLDDGKQFDKISGNIKLVAALTFFMSSGHLKAAAEQLLKQAEG